MGKFDTAVLKSLGPKTCKKKNGQVKVGAQCNRCSFIAKSGSELSKHKWKKHTKTLAISYLNQAKIKDTQNPKHSTRDNSTLEDLTFIDVSDETNILDTKIQEQNQIDSL